MSQSQCKEYRFAPTSLHMKGLTRDVIISSNGIIELMKSICIDFMTQCRHSKTLDTKSKTLKQTKIIAPVGVIN